MFLVEGVLRLAHDGRDARRGLSLEATYVAPLSRILASCGHLTGNQTPFLFNIELKTRTKAAFDSLPALIARYPQLSARDRISLVMVGWYPSGMNFRGSVLQANVVLSDTIGAEASSNAALVSLDYGKTIGRWWRTPKQKRYWIDLIRAQKRRAPHVPVRAHNVPLNAEVYRQLLSAGVDFIGTKNLRASRPLLAGRR